MSLISAVLLQWSRFSLKPALHLPGSLILLTGQVDTLRGHFDSAKKADEFMLFQLFTERLHLIAHFANDGTGSLLNLPLNCVLFGSEIGCQLPQDLVLEAVDLPCRKSLLDQVAVGLHFPRQLI